MGHEPSRSSSSSSEERVILHVGIRHKRNSENSGGNEIYQYEFLVVLTSMEN